MKQTQRSQTPGEQDIFWGGENQGEGGKKVQ
jgi:hypothetical protein